MPIVPADRHNHANVHCTYREMNIMQGEEAEVRIDKSRE